MLMDVKYETAIPSAKNCTSFITHLASPKINFYLRIGAITETTNPYIKQIPKPYPYLKGTKRALSANSTGSKA